MAEEYRTWIGDILRTEVLVIGSGSAGATAAITAAEQGATVTLIERYGFIGGISTQGLDTFYGFYTPGSEERKVVGGILDRVVAELMRRGKALYRPNTYGAGRGITYDPETLKVIWEAMARQAGVEADRMLIGHLDRNLHWDYHLAIARTGVYMGFDQISKEK